MSKDRFSYERWLTPYPLKPEEERDPLGPAIDPLDLELFTPEQQKFIKRRIALQAPDIRTIARKDLATYFQRNKGINMSLLILTFVFQYLVRFRKGTAPSVRGNIRSFWYRYLARTLERLGLLDEPGGLRVSLAAKRSKQYLKIMENSFETLFLQKFFRYKDLDIFFHRERFCKLGREHKRHLFYIEKEGLFWFCNAMHDRHSLHVYASRGTASWLDVDYLANFILQLKVRNLYIACLTDYDPWGFHIANHIRDKFMAPVFNFRSIHMDVLTDLSLFDPKVIQAEKRYLLKGHEKPDDPIQLIVEKWVEQGGGIDGKPYGLHIDHADYQKRVPDKVRRWLRGEHRPAVTDFTIPKKLWRAACRLMKEGDA